VDPKVRILKSQQARPVICVNSVISLYYYARVVRTMFLDFPEGNEAPVTVGLHNGSLMWGLCAATLVLGVYWSPVIGLAERLRAVGLRERGGIYFVPAFSGLFAPYWQSDAAG
jgi:hypothetical protein